MTRYLVGTETRLQVVEHEPHVMRYPDGTPMASMAGTGFAFKIVRGRLQEFRSQGFPGGEHVYARELPEDASDDLADLDEKVSLARAALSRAQLERQAFLANTVVRGKLIKAAVPAPSSGDSGEGGESQ